MKKLLMMLMFVMCMVSCTNNTKTQCDFINDDCNIPIIECVLCDDTVSMIIDTGAEYSIIDSKYFQENPGNFRVMSEVDICTYGIAGTIRKEDTKVINSYTSLGIMTLVEQDLTAVRKSLSKYNVVGLIGSDFLKSRNYVVDYELRKLYHYSLRDSIYKSYGN